MMIFTMMKIKDRRKIRIIKGKGDAIYETFYQEFIERENKE